MIPLTTILFAIFGVACGTPLSSSDPPHALAAESKWDVVTTSSLYVDGVNGDDANDGLTVDSAIKTLDQANSLIASETALFIMNGTYSKSSYGNGGKNNGALLTISNMDNILISNLDGHIPKLLFDGSAAITGSNVASVEIRGIEIVGPNDDITYEEAMEDRLLHSNKLSGRGIVFWSGHHIHIHDNHVSKTPNSGIRVNKGDYVRIESNVVHSCTWWTSSAESAIVLAESLSADDSDDVKMMVNKNVVFDNFNRIPYYNENYDDPQYLIDNNMHVARENYGSSLQNFIIDGSGVYITRNDHSYEYGYFQLSENVCYGNGINGVVVHKTARAFVHDNVIYGNGVVSKEPPSSRQSYSGLTLNHATDVMVYGNMVTTTYPGDYIFVEASSTFLDAPAPEMNYGCGGLVQGSWEERVTLYDDGVTNCVSIGDYWSLDGDCNTYNYYDVDLENPTEGEKSAIWDYLLNRISGHTIIPYTSSTKTDCWDALISLDVDPLNPSNVLLIYSLASVPALPYGTSSTWNREHVWPKSFGVGYTGPDTSDIHSLRAADWSVNSARSNRAFDNCDPDTNDQCEIPAHAEAPTDSGKYPGFFMPPLERRGDVARSMFYMALRYGSLVPSDSNTEVLVLGDCPCQSRNEMGKLSVLLDWHEADPVDEKEMTRNNVVCKDYQHNRNPFVDFPDLARYFYNHMRLEAGGECGECPVEDYGDSDDEDGSSGVVDITDFPYEAGDVAITSFSSDSPKSVEMILTKDLPFGAKLSLTDDAYLGDGNWRGSEGTLHYTVPVGGSRKGDVIRWIDGGENPDWEEEGTFTLSTGGEQIIALGWKSSGEKTFLFGVQYRTSSGWDSADCDSSSCSVLPEGLDEGITALSLTHKDNYRYEGKRVVGWNDQGEAAAIVADESSWVGSDTPFSDESGGGDGWIVIPETCEVDDDCLDVDWKCEKVVLPGGRRLFGQLKEDGSGDVEEDAMKCLTI